MSSNSSEASNELAESSGIGSAVTDIIPEGMELVPEYSDELIPGFIPVVRNETRIPAINTNNSTAENRDQFDDLDGLSDHSNHSDIAGSTYTLVPDLSTNPVDGTRHFYAGVGEDGLALYMDMGTAKDIKPLNLTTRIPEDLPDNQKRHAMPALGVLSTGPGGYGVWKTKRTNLDKEPFNYVRQYEDAISVFIYVFECINVVVEPDLHTHWIPRTGNAHSRHRDSLPQTVPLAGVRRINQLPSSDARVSTNASQNTGAQRQPNNVSPSNPQHSNATRAQASNASLPSTSNNGHNNGRTNGHGTAHNGGGSSNNNTLPSQTGSTASGSNTTYGTRISGNPFASNTPNQTGTTSNAPNLKGNQVIQIVSPVAVTKKIRLDILDVKAVFDFTTKVKNFNLSQEPGHPHYPVAMAIDPRVLQTAFTGTDYDMDDLHNWTSDMLLNLLRFKVLPTQPSIVAALWGSDEVLAFKKSGDYQTSEFRNRQKYLRDCQMFLKDTQTFFSWLIEGKTSSEISRYLPRVYRSSAGISLIGSTLAKMGTKTSNYAKSTFEDSENKPYFQEVMDRHAKPESAYPLFVQRLTHLLEQSLKISEKLLAEELKMHPSFNTALENCAVDTLRQKSNSERQDAQDDKDLARNARYMAAKKNMGLHHIAEQIDSIAQERQQDDSDNELFCLPIATNPEFQQLAVLEQLTENMLNAQTNEQRAYHGKALATAYTPLKKFVQEVKKRDPANNIETTINATPMVCIRHIRSGFAPCKGQCKYSHDPQDLMDFARVLQKEYYRVKDLEKGKDNTQQKEQPSHPSTVKTYRNNNQMLQLHEEGEREPPIFPSSMLDSDSGSESGQEDEDDD
jgi:hypothetical protein